jgi:hypothetical protein
MPMLRSIDQSIRTVPMRGDDEGRRSGQTNLAGAFARPLVLRAWLMISHRAEAGGSFRMARRTVEWNRIGSCRSQPPSSGSRGDADASASTKRVRSSIVCASKLCLESVRRGLRENISFISGQENWSVRAQLSPPPCKSGREIRPNLVSCSIPVAG